MKSYFYGKDLQKLHGQKAVRVKETKHSTTIEFIYKFNWSEEIKRQHPKLRDFCVRCIGKSRNNVPFKAGVLDKGKEEGHFFFQYGPNLDIVNRLLNDPKTVYDLSQKEMVQLHIF